MKKKHREGQNISAFDKIYDIVVKIPYGCVASYGQITFLAGNPRWARVVGYALHVNPKPGIIPCHRVVMKDGSLTKSFAFGGEEQQRLLLKSEGITFTDDDKVDMHKHAWL